MPKMNVTRDEETVFLVFDELGKAVPLDPEQADETGRALIEAGRDADSARSVTAEDVTEGSP